MISYTFEDIYIVCESSLYVQSPYTMQEYGTILHSMCRVLNTSYKVGLHIVKDAVMNTYTQKYLQAIGPTNILSFEASKENGLCIELILSLETLGREAVLYQQERAEYAIFLLAHGFVHGLGYEHGKEMNSLCERCVYAVNI